MWKKDGKKYSFLEIFEELPIECIFYKAIINSEECYCIQLKGSGHSFQVCERDPYETVIRAYRFYSEIDGIVCPNALEKTRNVEED